MKLTILIPVYNEQKHLAAVFARVLGHLAKSPLSGRYVKEIELLVIDDCSTDGSREWLIELEKSFSVEYGKRLAIPCAYRLLLQERNQGKGAAICRGIDASTGDVLLIQDADLEYHPEDYDVLLLPMIKGEVDACFGSRFLGSRARWLSFFHSLVNKFLTVFFNVMSRTRLTDVETCYKVMRGDLARALRLGSKRFGIELELTARLSRVGARIKEVGIGYSPRTYNEGKKVGPRDGIAALFHIVRYNVFDTAPFKPGRAQPGFKIRPRARSIAAFVFAAALVIRLIFVSQWLKTPYSQYPLLDAKAYDRWALDILDGHWLRERAFYQSPLYPYLLAGIYKIFGHSLSVVACLQAVLGALSCGLIALLTTLYFGEAAGLASGVLALLYRPLIFYSAPAMKETLGVFLLALFLVQVMRALDVNKKRNYLFAGAILGLTALARGNILLLAPLTVAIAFSRYRKAALPGLAIFTLATTLFVLPATIHNYVASHDFVLLNYTGGFDFYMGNSATASGANAYPDEVSSEPLQEEQDTTRLAQSALGRELKPSEVSRYWFEKGLGFALSHPMEEMAAVLNKIWYFANDYEQPDNYDVGFIARNMDTLLAWPLVGFGLVLLLGCFGWIASRATERERRSGTPLALLAAGYAVSVLLFYVTDRYRLPMVVFLLPFAGAAFPLAWTLLRSKRFVRLASAGLATLPMGFLAFSSVSQDPSFVEAFDWGVLASAYSDQKQDREAEEAIQKALRLNAKAVNGEALTKASTSAERLGHEAEAERLLKFAIQSHPSDGFAFYNFARFHMERNDLPTALEYFQKAAELMPWQYQPYLGLTLVHMRSGRTDAALESLRKGLAINPSSPELQTCARDLNARSPAAAGGLGK